MEKYLIIFRHGNYLMFTANNIKSAVIKCFNYNTNNLMQIKLLETALKHAEDIDIIIQMYNQFTQFNDEKIKTIYRIKDCLYGEENS